jgi:hypothetical protein
MNDFTIQKNVALPRQPIISRVGRLLTFFAAKRAGLRSESAWKKRGREVVEGSEPTGFVVSQVKVSQTVYGDEAAVLESLGDGSYRVVRHGWFVYGFDQTQPKVTRARQTRRGTSVSPKGAEENEVPASLDRIRDEATDSQLHSNDSKDLLPFSPPSPPSLPPLVSTITADNGPNLNTADDLQAINDDKKSWELLGEGSRQRRAVPSAYVPETWVADLGPLQEESYCFLHLMRLYQFLNGLSDDDWVDMAFEQCNRLIPNYSKVLKLLLQQGLVECTTVLEHPLGFEIPRGIAGIAMYGTHRAYGYRLVDPAYRHNRWTKRPITKQSILRRLDDYENVKYPVQRWLRDNNTCLEVIDPPDAYLEQLAQSGFEDEGSGERRRRSYEGTLRLIRDKTWLCTFDSFSRRFHNNATALKRELRPFLRVAGEPLVEIDIKAAQPLFLGLVARQKGILGADQFLKVCEEDLYQYLADKGGWSREHVKEQLMQRALFSSNNSPSQKTAVKRRFDQEFPDMARFFREAKYGRPTKTNPKPHNKLARMAQKAEVNFVIFTVCERIRKERPECWLTTIHDSVLCRPRDGEYVRGVMLEEFDRLGFCPRLEVRRL